MAAERRRGRRRRGPEVPADGKDISIEDLMAEAKKEGTINTIALPPDWANYGEIMVDLPVEVRPRA